MDDDERRRALYDGQIFVYSPTPNTRALSELARELAERAFAPLDPRSAQHELSVEQFIEVLQKLKPEFGHFIGRLGSVGHAFRRNGRR